MFERLRYRLIGSVLAWDIVLTMLSLHLASKTRLRLDLGYDLSGSQIILPWPVYGAVALIWIIVFLLLTPQRALFSSSMLESLGRLVAAVALASLTFAGLLYLSLRDVSRLQFLYFAIFNLVTLLLFHLTVLAIVRWRQRNGWRRRVLIVGGGMFAEPLTREFERRPWAGMRVVGVVGDQEYAVAGLPWLGHLWDTAQIVQDWRINEVIFTLPPQQQDQIIRVSLELQQQPVMLHMVPGVLDLAFARTPIDSVGGIPLISLRESALTGPQRVLKRLFDISASLILLMLLAPVMLVIALLIQRDSPGPIFFRQERIGESGRRFKMLKFRTMYIDAEQRWQEVACRDANGNLIHKAEQDPRITSVGRKLRRTSLDELPQLINVLRGEMSLVGPRPEMPYIAAEYQPWQWQRFRVPPGITGWWQVNGRSEKPMHLHTEDDLYYIQNYSFWLDLHILLRTVRVIFNGRGAY
jgi:exopolysaccharide biosynthesis polyprenyl glycosylphosphotransferase